VKTASYSDNVALYVAPCKIIATFSLTYIMSDELHLSRLTLAGPCKHSLLLWHAGEAQQKI